MRADTLQPGRKQRQPIGYGDAFAPPWGQETLSATAINSRILDTSDIGVNGFGRNGPATLPPPRWAPEIKRTGSRGNRFASSPASSRPFRFGIITSDTTTFTVAAAPSI